MVIVRGTRVALTITNQSDMKNQKIEAEERSERNVAVVRQEMR